MKKIFKNKEFKFTLALAIIVVLIVLCFIFKVNENIATRVTKVLWVNYYNVECVDSKCKFVAAYKGNKKGKSTVKIINSDGKTVIKYNTDASDELTKEIVAATNNYAIIALKDDKDYTHGYSVINSRGKEVLNEEEVTLFTITDTLFYSKKGELYTIYDYKGNIVYKDVKDIKFYDNNKIITFINNELTIIDKDGDIILNGYNIAEEVKDKDNNTLYLLVSDKDNSYYYFDVNNKEIKGESFTSYVVYSNKKLVVTRKNNNKTNKYLLGTNGDIETELDSSKTIYDKLSKNIDSEKYAIIDDSLVDANQKGILVRNKEDNSFGNYDIKSNKYNKIFSFKESLNEDPILASYTLYQDENDAFLEVGCSLNYCNEENIIVYNPYTNSVSFNVTNSEKDIKNYREYSDGYKVITYRDKTHSLIDKEGNELLNSSNNIIVIDQKMIVDDNLNESNVILYSSKDKKAINNDESLALLDKSSNYDIYKYYDDDYLYIYSEKGELLKKIPISQSSIFMGDKYFSYLSKNKINIYSFINDKTISIDLKTGEKITDKDGKNIEPNKGAIVVSNTDDNTIRILNYNKKTLKKINR